MLKLASRGAMLLSFLGFIMRRETRSYVAEFSCFYNEEGDLMILVLVLCILSFGVGLFLLFKPSHLVHATDIEVVISLYLFRPQIQHGRAIDQLSCTNRHYYAQNGFFC